MQERAISLASNMWSEESECGILRGLERVGFTFSIQYGEMLGFNAGEKELDSLRQNNTNTTDATISVHVLGGGQEEGWLVGSR